MKVHPVVYLSFMLVIGVVYILSYDLKISNQKIYELEMRIDTLEDLTWDTWSVDHTLTLIIIPLLKQLKATKYGSPIVDHKDVPDHLLPSDEEKNLKEWETDSNFHLRWDWVISEMIWAFEQLRDDNWEEQYIKFKDSDNLLNMELEYEDKIGLKKHQERINNGLRLFGKYYTNLWD